MVQETRHYLDQMTKGYLAILEKMNRGLEISKLESLFIETYHRTIGSITPPGN